MVEELIHIKFDDKEPDNKMSQLVESFSDFHVSEDTPKVCGSEAGCSQDYSLEVDGLEDGGLESNPTFEAHPKEVSSEEAHDVSQEAAQSKKTFKYKSSYPEEKIIGNKDSPPRKYLHSEKNTLSP